MNSPAYVGFGEAMCLFFKNYFNFSGRSTRSEFWYFMLFDFLVNICSSLIARFLAPAIGYLNIVWFIVTFIPSISLAIRRLHDRGKPWWYFLTSSLVAGIIGGIIFFSLLEFAKLGKILPYLFVIYLYIYFYLVYGAESDYENRWGPSASISTTTPADTSQDSSIIQNQETTEETIPELKPDYELVKKSNHKFAVVKNGDPTNFFCPYCYKQISPTCDICKYCNKKL